MAAAAAAAAPAPAAAKAPSIAFAPPAVDPLAAEFVDYLNATWTPFHCVANAKADLLAAGFTELLEREAWSLAAGGRYFFTRNMSTVVAFAVGAKYTPGNGFVVVGAHTDSPCPKLKPVSKLTKGGYLGLSVAGYGGGLWHTWFDRDLSVAGRVIVRRDGKLCHELVRVNRPILKIPTLAIHLNRGTATDFKFNLQSKFPPVLASAAKVALEADETAEGLPQHHPLLLRVLAAELGCAPADIVDFELQLCDTQPSAITGALNEFISSGRLDNLCNCFCAIEALKRCSTPESLAEESAVRMIALFDHEEVGSSSTTGAGGPVMMDAMKRITGQMAMKPAASSTGDGEAGAMVRAMQSSYLVSADMAHALHPNYSEKHDRGLQPKLGAGVVIKLNANQRYATTSVTSFFFKELGVRAGELPFQEFAVPADCACGSTIGPILSSQTGIRTVDVGAAQWGMHSVRETMGTADIAYTVKHFVACFEGFTALDSELQVDGVPYTVPAMSCTSVGTVALAPLNQGPLNLKGAL